MKIYSPRQLINIVDLSGKTIQSVHTSEFGFRNECALQFTDGSLFFIVGEQYYLGDGGPDPILVFNNEIYGYSDIAKQVFSIEERKELILRQQKEYKRSEIERLEKELAVTQRLLNEAQSLNENDLGYLDNE